MGTWRCCLDRTCLFFLSEKQVISDTGLALLDTPGKTRQNLFEKPCRIVGAYEKGSRGVFRTCWWVTCGSPVTMTGRRRTCNVTRCSTPEWLRTSCLPTRRVGRAMIARASSKRWRMSNP